MARGELLLELLSEEIPARMQRRAIADLTALVRDKLAAAKSRPRRLRGYVTPRRLTRDRRRHPASASPTAARSGAGRASARRSRRSTAFCAPPGLPRSSNARSATPGAANSISRYQPPGPRRPTEVLPELLHAAIAELAVAEIDALSRPRRCAGCGR